MNRYKDVAQTWLEHIFQYKNLELKVGTHPFYGGTWVSLQITLELRPLFAASDLTQEPES
jgi:hypothetical protein